MSNSQFFVSEQRSARFALAASIALILSILSFTPLFATSATAPSSSSSSPSDVLLDGSHDRWSPEPVDRVAIELLERSLFTVEALSDDDSDAALLVEVSSSTRPVAHWLSAAAVLAPEGAHEVRVTRADGEPLGAYRLRVAIAPWTAELWKDGDGTTSGDGTDTHPNDDHDDEVVVPFRPDTGSLAWKDGDGTTPGDGTDTDPDDDHDDEVVIPRGPGGGLLTVATRRTLCSSGHAPGFLCARRLAPGDATPAEVSAASMWTFHQAERATVSVQVPGTGAPALFDARGRRLHGVASVSQDRTRFVVTLPKGRYFVRPSRATARAAGLRLGG